MNEPMETGVVCPSHVPLVLTMKSETSIFAHDGWEANIESYYRIGTLPG